MYDEYMLPEMSKYKVELNYGYTVEEEGVFHSFVTADPKGERCYGAIEGKLADLLSTDAYEDGRFGWNTMDVAIPQSVVDRIKAEAIAEYELEKSVNELKEANDRSDKVWRKVRTMQARNTRKRRF